MPKVDVIIPAYNAATFLPATLQSVESQTFEDWRILLVNDGSTDNTTQVIAPYQERMRHKLIHIQQANAGLPAARNKAIRHSSAEFLAILDADDIWLPWRLEESLKSFENRPQIGLSYGMIRYIDANGNMTAWQDRRQKNAEGNIATHIYTRKVNLPCPTITFRRNCVEDVGLFDETMRATEDRDMWLRIAVKYEIAFIERVIAHYRLSPNSMSSDLNRMITAQLNFVEKHRNMPGCGLRRRREALSLIYKQHADALSARHQWRPALQSSLRALAFNPFDWANARATGSLFLQQMKAKR